MQAACTERGSRSPSHHLGLTIALTVTQIAAAPCDVGRAFSGGVTLAQASGGAAFACVFNTAWSRPEVSRQCNLPYSDSSSCASYLPAPPMWHSRRADTPSFLRRAGVGSYAQGSYRTTSELSDFCTAHQQQLHPCSATGGQWKAAGMHSQGRHHRNVRPPPCPPENLDPRARWPLSRSSALARAFKPGPRSFSRSKGRQGCWAGS